VTVAPSPLAFGTVQVGGMFSTQAVSVNNTGTIPATIPIMITGTDAALFTVFANSCPATLAVGSSCTVTMRFNPTTLGTKSATLGFGMVASVPMSANVVMTATLTATPAILDFSNVTMAGGPVTQFIDVTNTSTAGLTVTTTFGGTDAPSFTIASTTCPSPLSPGASCTLTVRFTPGALGAKSAVLNLGTPTAGTVSLAANVVSAPTFTVSPGNPLSFPSAPVNTMSGPTLNVVITNAGATAVPFALNLTGADASQFVVASTTCPPNGSTLAGNANCSMTMRFMPTSVGAQNAILAVGSPMALAVTLSGNGI
jgi:hypothetical protein